VPSIVHVSKFYENITMSAIINIKNRSTSNDDVMVHKNSDWLARLAYRALQLPIAFVLLAVAYTRVA